MPLVQFRIYHSVLLVCYQSFQSNSHPTKSLGNTPSLTFPVFVLFPTRRHICWQNLGGGEGGYTLQVRRLLSPTEDPPPLTRLKAFAPHKKVMVSLTY